MKNVLCAIFALSLLTACSSPVLKWIDTPKEELGGNNGDKAILSFSFNKGETVHIGDTPDSSGRTPILVILPAGIEVNPLAPAIEFIGKFLNPPPGRSADFSVPRLYTVTAEDGSTREYLVTVSVKDDTSKAILRFVIDLPSALVAEGIIDEDAGTIAIEVPADTDLRSMSARIIHNGASLTDPNEGDHASESVSFSGDFSVPAQWIVTAQDNSKKTYTVTVTKRKNSDKEIMAFSFGMGESVIIGSEPQPDGKYPILAFVSGADAGDLAGLTPALVYKGSFISPGEHTPGNFSNPANPVVYTVTAEDHSSRDYVVRVVLKETGGSADKQITGFYFTDPLIEGVINENAGTIAITVPQGTNLTGQRPEIYFLGASVSPTPGQLVDFSGATGTTPAPVEYTVSAQDKSSKTYRVSVFILAVPTPPVITVQDSGNEKVDIGIDAGGIDTGGGGGGGNISDSGNYTAVVEMPVHIENPVININYPGAGNTVNITSIDRTKNVNLSSNVFLENNYLNITNNDVFNYIPIQLSNDEYLYVLAVNPPSGEVPESTDPAYPAWQAAASIDALYFASPVAVGTIGTGEGTEASPIPISVTVPYGTNLRNLAAAICYTGKEIVGIPGGNPLKAGARSFTDPVDYTVRSYSNITKYYRVTVSEAPNTAKDITAFGFTGLNPTGIIIGGSPNADGDYPILITVPNGEPIDSLTPVITHTGSSVGGGGFSPAGGPGIQTAGSAVDFSLSSGDPVEYTVQDWVTPTAGSKTYAVTVRHEGGGDGDIEITGFYFASPLAAGIINQEANTIAVIVPSATDTTGLVPSVYFKGMSLSPGSDRANNFDGPVIYTVTGINGKTRSYTVTVTKTPSSSKDLTGFDFPGVAGSETVIGAVPGPDGSYPVSVFVPAGTDLGSLSPDIVYSGISIGPDSGVPQNFNGPQTYTITAEDGSTKTYTVTTTPLSGSSKLITSLVFNNVPLSGGGTIRALGAIDQTSHTITAAVPHTADISGLAPTITYIGRSIAGPGGGDQTANPFTDGVRNFGADQTYTVKDQSGAEQPYTVKVLRQSAATVTFTGNADLTVIGSNAFDQTTGVITINAVDNIGPPYEWYVDGVKQGVSATEPGFTLNVGGGDFIPGRHEIMLSGKSPANGLHYTGKVSFTVAGGSK